MSDYSQGLSPYFYRTHSIRMNKTHCFSKRSSVRISYKKGFGAAVALILLSTSSLAFAMLVLAASVSFSDLVFRREVRIQDRINKTACSDVSTLVKEKDSFATGTITVKDLGCSII